MTISIDDSCHDAPQIYTTGSVITGRAIVYSEIDAYCEKAEILLLGLAGTRLELTRHKPTRALSPFLKMYMTAECDAASLELDSPFPGFISAGQTVSIPFSFIVPQYLLEDSCHHRCASQAVWERHAHLPPTLDGANEDEHEFLARGRIRYYVEMRLRFHENSKNNDEAVVCASAEYNASRVIAGRQMVTILPALPELPPLPLDSLEFGIFLQSNSIVARKNILQRAGRLKASSTQPPAMMLDPWGRSSPCSVLHLELDFFPSDASSHPPNKLVVSGVALGTTHLCAEPSELLPELSCKSGGMGGGGNGPTTVQYSSAQKLFQLTPVLPAWHRIQGLTEGDYYRAQLEMPLSLPVCQQKPILPTFYSCLISQTYTLEVRMSLGLSSPNLALTLPLQIGVCSTYFSG